MKPIEVYFVQKEIFRFREELGHFIGYVTRRHCPTFRQSSCDFEIFRDRALERIYDNVFINGHYDMKKRKHPDMKFASYIYTQCRGELTKYLSKNKHKKVYMYSLYQTKKEREKNYKLYQQYFSFVKKIIENYRLNISPDSAMNALFYDGNCSDKDIFIAWILYLNLFDEKGGGEDETERYCM